MHPEALEELLGLSEEMDSQAHLALKQLQKELSKLKKKGRRCAGGTQYMLHVCFDLC